MSDVILIGILHIIYYAMYLNFSTIAQPVTVFHFYSQGFFELKKKCNFYSKLRAQCTAPQVYMAPEAMERDEFTAAADVYSFGEGGRGWEGEGRGGEGRGGEEYGNVAHSVIVLCIQAW